MNDEIEHPNLTTIVRPYGGEIFMAFQDRRGNPIVLTYNDLWVMIVCRSSMDGDWRRAKEAAGMAADPRRKQALVDRLWKLEQKLDGLPALDDGVIKLNLHRAHVWFNQRTVSDSKRW
jgi:hypothetical protein